METKRVSLEFLSTLLMDATWICNTIHYISLQYILEMYNGDRIAGEAVDLQTKWLAIVGSMLTVRGWPGTPTHIHGARVKRYVAMWRWLCI